MIRLGPAFTADEAREYAKSTWWVRNDSRKDGEPGRWAIPGGCHDGTEPLELRLGPGRYTIGAGPPEAYRREIRIGLDGAEVSTRAPCIRPGCAGLVAYLPSSPPPRCKPFDLDPPDARLCAGCKGAP